MFNHWTLPAAAAAATTTTAVIRNKAFFWTQLPSRFRSKLWTDFAICFLSSISELLLSLPLLLLLLLLLLPLQQQYSYWTFNNETVFSCEVFFLNFFLLNLFSSIYRSQRENTTTEGGWNTKGQNSDHFSFSVLHRCYFFINFNLECYWKRIFWIFDLPFLQISFFFHFFTLVIMFAIFGLKRRRERSEKWRWKNCWGGFLLCFFFFFFFIFLS